MCWDYWHVYLSQPAVQEVWIRLLKPKSQKNTAAEEETEAPEEAEEEQEETSKEQEESVEDSNTVYAVGNNAESGDWNINVTDAQIVESIVGDYGSFSPDTDGSKYIHVLNSVL